MHDKDLIGLAAPREKVAKRQMSVGVTDEEFLLIRDISAELGMTQSDYLRKLMEGGLETLRHVRGSRAISD